MYSFSVIHIFLALITFICGLYSIHDCRYTYKRLTGMLYILTGNNDSEPMTFFWKIIIFFYIF